MGGLQDLFAGKNARIGSTRKQKSSAGSSQSVINIGNREIPLTIRRHPRSRSISLRIDTAKRGISVTMPHWAAKREALAFIASRSEWIEQRLAALGPNKVLANHDMVSFCGNDYQINWSKDHLRTPDLRGGMLLVGGEEALIAGRIERWLKAKARTIFADDLAEYCERAGESKIPRIGLSNARRRWGSCSQSGWVRVQWRLIMAPANVRRAVIAHEVAHLRHMDHSQRFYDWMDTIYEGDRAAADAWLKAHGNSLYGVQFSAG
jgi:predicted metal-dependent hydrolase